MSDAPLVTIAVPTFNRAGSLERCLESALGQSYGPIEIIVCDNASTDNTEEVARRALAGHELTRYLRQETNLGAVANFRAGLDQANGEYFMWLADDDWLDPDFVARCVEVLKTNAGAVLANGDAIYYADGHPEARQEGINLTRASAPRRVLRYFASVTRNAAFYGLSTAEARRAVSLDDALGSDWVHVAELVALGSVHRVPVTIHRSHSGASTVVVPGLARFTRPIAKLAATDVQTAAAFSEMGPMTRQALALACAGVVYWRYGVLYVRDQLLGLVVRPLKARLRADDYRRLRRAYHRLLRRSAPDCDQATPQKLS